ncbi:DUF4870 domain-containing protein [Demequina sp. NBRC 110054]|uniref:DUF4870 domain-containing protein n=1 Tax=Demequina sp. NBRC 110054 TaxID=1570343 RepID=UPI0011789E3D|nr:DUF4870 domain-containing protein [Demequina sp. NBRC 110054]
MSESDERLYATLGHAGIILFGFVPPLIVWLIGKDRSAFVDSQGKEALNFSILMVIGQIIGWATSIIFIGFLILLAVFVVTLVFCIQAAIAVNKGEDYRYPFNWRIIK